MSDPTGATTPTGTAEHGDRIGFLGRLRARLATGIPANDAHPAPPPSLQVPPIGYRNLDHGDLVGSFVRAATACGTVVHSTDKALPDDEWLAALVAERSIERAVLSEEPESAAVGAGLSRIGVEVAPSTSTLASTADLGVTSARALVAATGSLLLRSDDTGTRSVSLLPRVHLCVVPVDRVVAHPADVLRVLAGRPDQLPSNLVLVSGPSRTGDIEQLITLGVHGPVAVHVVLTGRASAS
ncbi:MAG: LUD domain-containing protein [Acidimicrobiales bacterium]